MYRTTFAFKTLLVTLLLLVAGCSSQVTSEVTRFHRAPAPHGETIAIVPMDAAKSGSLEFADYAGQVATRLAQLGYKVVTSGPADIFARMDYIVGPGETRISNWPDNYVHYHFYYGRKYPYYYGHFWDEPYVYAYTVFPRSLEIKLVGSDGKVIFEGKVKSVGRQRNINEVMPYLIDAMFQNFPGESGVTKVVTIRKGPDGQLY